ncbi:hypothetical protein D910_01416 [Dendroctonus ponderosae]
MKLKMRLYLYLDVAVIISIFVIIFYLYSIKQISQKEQLYSELSTTENLFYNNNELVVAVVACGDRLNETLTLIKSALMFSKGYLNFIVIAEDKLKENLNEKDVLPDVDALLYMDTDTLFLTPVESIWRYFNKFNASQMAALAPEHEDPAIAWYNRFAKHPYYGKLGVNSGVMLMNLTRMRLFKWTEYVVPIYKKYKLHITWGDQDIINIIFHYHPGKLFIYSCRYNYRPDHCMYSSICKAAEKNGVAVIHGSRGFFHSEKQPIFKEIYNVFYSFQLGSDIYRDFYQPVEAHLDTLENTNCGKLKNVFLKNIRRYLDLDFDNT